MKKSDAAGLTWGCQVFHANPQLCTGDLQSLATVKIADKKIIQVETCYEVSSSQNV